MWSRRVTREPLDSQVSRRPEDYNKEAPEDLLELEDLTETDLLQALFRRYEKHQIYTWVGSVLVSVNPYRDVGAFSEEAVARYSAAMSPPGPHLFAVVKAALADAPGSRHALLITGESGSGKTEATRAILQFLALRHTSAGNVRDRLLRSTPVLEAFGNAQTRQNSNSSRFGKFIEVQLSAGGEVLGASLTPYMLEASRVSGELVTGERTYHIFYLLRQALACTAAGSTPSTPFWIKLTNASEWNRLASRASGALNASRRLQATAKHEASVPSGDAGAGSCGPLEEFEALTKSMMGTGLTDRHVIQACSILAAVSVLGDDEASSTPATLAASLLGVPEADLTQFLAKTELMIGVGRQERVFRERGEREAKTLRASLAQEIYAALFNWLTKQVGRSIAAQPEALDQPGVRLIGLLDLYGFEVFSSNGFEQFLINYCNERLQQLFNRQLFQREAEEYLAENLSGEGQWKHLMEATIKACTLPALSLFEGDASTGSAGLFAIINDRSRTNFQLAGSCGPSKAPATTATPDETDGSALVETIVARSSKNPAFCRAGKDSRRMFGIRHFAGEVLYEAASFVQKNASANRPDIVRFLSKHGGSFVQELFEATPEPQGASANTGSGKPRKLFGKTLISSFQQELNELCSTLEARRCRHVRCLRPNDEQKPLFFVDAAVQRQCRYSGLMEATRMRRQGFSHRRALHVFAERYSFVLPERAARREVMAASPLQAARACHRITAQAAKAGVDMDNLQVGKTKVFLREDAMHWLDAARRKGAATLVFAALSGHVTRQRFFRMRRSALRIQTATRGMQARLLTQQLLAEARAMQALREAEEAARLANAASCKVQCAWRRHQAIRLLQQLRQTQLRLQQQHLEQELQKQKQQQQQQQQLQELQQESSQRRSRSLDKQPALVWPLHRETLREQAEAAAATPAPAARSFVPPPPPILRHSSNRGKKDVLLGSAASQETVLIPTPTRSVRAAISWEPPSSRSIFSSSCSSIHSQQSNKTKNGSYQPRSLKEEYAGLLSNIQHLLSELPAHSQGRLRTELLRTSKRLENPTSLLTAQEFEAIERSIQKAEVQIERYQKVSGSGAHRGSSACGGSKAGPSQGGRVAQWTPSRGPEGVTMGGRVPLAVAAGAVPSRPIPPHQPLPSHHQSYVPISPRTNMGAWYKASTPRLGQLRSKGASPMGAQTQPARRCGSANPMRAQAAAEAAAATAAAAAAAARKGLQRVGGPYLPSSSRGTASTTTSSQSSLGNTTTVVGGGSSAGVSAATTAADGVPLARPVPTAYAVVASPLAGLNTWAPATSSASAMATATAAASYTHQSCSGGISANNTNYSNSSYGNSWNTDNNHNNTNIHNINDINHVGVGQSSNLTATMAFTRPQAESRSRSPAVFRLSSGGRRIVVPNYMTTPRLRVQSPTQSMKNLSGTPQGIMTCRATPIRSTAAIGGTHKDSLSQAYVQSPPRRRLDPVVVVLHSPRASPVVEARPLLSSPQQALPQRRLR